MNYLAYSDPLRVIERFPSLFGTAADRLVGPDRSFDSGYFQIVRFFRSDAFDPSAITVNILPGQYQIPDPLIQNHANEISERMRLEGRLYDGPMVAGAIGLRLDGTSPEVVIQRTSYADFAGSVMAPDQQQPFFDDHGGTLREYYYLTYGLTELNQRPLANCFGVCGHLLIEEGSSRYIMQVRRSRNLATLPSSKSATVAGSVDFSEKYGTLAGMIAQALGTEVREELNLQPDEFSIVPLATAREVMRPDNPQLFALIRTSLDRRSIWERIEKIDPEHREFDSFEFFPLDDNCQIGEKEFGELTFEGKMSIALAAEWLHFHR